MGGKRGSPTERFWRFVKKTENCWIWTGAKTSEGYGKFRIGAGALVRAHRFVYELVFGKIQDEIDVLHKCDNPSCIRPDHLFLGTAQDNMQDCKKKGRTTTGNKNAQAKLLEKEVRYIREAYAAGTLNQPQLARKFGVDQKTVSRIARRENWTCVP
jgi:hypothetical protein